MTPPGFRQQRGDARPVRWDRWSRRQHGCLPISPPEHVVQYAIVGAIVPPAIRRSLTCRDVFHLAILDGPDRSGEALDEVAVVHHSQHRALELCHGALETLA